MRQKCFYLRIVFSTLNLNNLIMKQRKNIGNNLLLFYMYTMYVLPLPCLWTLRKTIQALIHRFVLFLIAG